MNDIRLALCQGLTAPPQSVFLGLGERIEGREKNMVSNINWDV